MNGPVPYNMNTIIMLHAPRYMSATVGSGSFMGPAFRREFLARPTDGFEAKDEMYSRLALVFLGVPLIMFIQSAETDQARI